ncbi:hypothetical protein P0D75_38775 [Paraburkholderia sediminicola]|uniref:hypothetical protein n=1 Tax=Paraburkholderia sediminicola TaxID=458836 RepID=UPI0038BD90B6
MAEHKVQQFYETEDEFHELGDEQTLDLTEEEEKLLDEGAGLPVYLDRHDGFFAVLGDD